MGAVQAARSLLGKNRVQAAALRHSGIRRGATHGVAAGLHKAAAAAASTATQAAAASQRCSPGSCTGMSAPCAHLAELGVHDCLKAHIVDLWRVNAGWEGACASSGVW